MTKINVLIAADVDRELLDRIGRDERFAVEYRPVRSEDELAGAVGSAEILVTRHHNKVTSRVLDAAPRLRSIVQGTSGLDNIDAAAAAGRGVAIAGLPGENANAVAELAIGLMISLTRTVTSYDRMVRSGGWNRDDCSSRRELRGHRLGIVGIGRVGGRVARLAAGFGVASSAYDPYLDGDEIARRGAKKCGALADLLAESDILTLHVPLTDETRGMIGAREIARLPAGAFIINTARGEVLDRDAARLALEQGRLAGLAMDVYGEEPPRDRWPDDPRLILTPHIAGCTREAKASIGRAVYAKICELQGLPPLE
ncbi:MAG TPA: NAD(P)-dependent oxidoreductase [Thermoanaerobaculia bacterium]|nr:NAD(P)-dependent oxidoreductase [Thermoanaerobaculia bacterium]